MTSRACPLRKIVASLRVQLARYTSSAVGCLCPGGGEHSDTMELNLVLGAVVVVPGIEQVDPLVGRTAGGQVCRVVLIGRLMSGVEED